MEQYDPILDNALADLTDAIITGKPPLSIPTMNLSSSKQTDPKDPLESPLRTLNALMNTSPSPEFRARLTARLNQEWDSVQRENRTRPVNRPWYQEQRTRWIALAAAVIVLTLAVAILRPGDGVNVPGLAFGNAEVPLIVAVLLVVGLVIGGLFSRRGRK